MDSSGRSKSKTKPAEVVRNSAPSRRQLHTKEIKKFEISSSKREAANKDYFRQLNLDRSRKLTLCLICILASITCLSPFLSLHLTRRVGLLLFESDLIQLKSSLFSVIICLLILVILYSVTFLISNNKNPKRKGLILQRLFKQLIGLFAIISAISYLALACLVPQIKQVQRMPTATFDCNANLITIENCHQQFTTRGGEQSISEAMGHLFVGDLSNNNKGNNDRLIKRLNCVQYNYDELGALKVPTRFLLHHCGLVCRPQRQQLHQFSDDLNREQQEDNLTPELAQRGNNSNTYFAGNSGQSAMPPSSRLIPPYQHAVKDLRQELEAMDGAHIIYHNTSGPSSGETPPALDNSQMSSARQVSLKVCFSSDFSSGSSNYKEFCITNLANTDHNHQQEHTLTVGQLNAMLRKFAPAQKLTRATWDTPPLVNDPDHVESGGLYERSKTASEEQIKSKQPVLIEDQTTHYVNPIVQFESHFKNWPHLTHRATSSLGGTDSDDLDESSDWCQFRPIPPFIVNNKPFNNIQCSLEQEYTMTTGPSLANGYTSGGSNKVADRIYLKKSSGDGYQSSDEGFSRERCNIQCKVNILYQVQANKRTGTSQNKRASPSLEKGSSDSPHYYLPLKPCVMISGDGDKTLTSNYYLLFRTTGDSTLLMAFILLDLFLLLEAIDTKQSHLESKKYRIIGLLLVLTLTPLTVSLLFDLISIYSPTYVQGRTKRENYLSALLFDRLLPGLVDLFYTRPSSGMINGSGGSKRRPSPDSKNLTANTTGGSQQMNLDLDRDKPPPVSVFTFDDYMVPFFIYSILMFILAINSWAIPLVSSAAPLNRVSSVEELGMSNVGSNNSVSMLNNRPSIKPGGLDRISSKPEPESTLKRRKINRKLAIKLISFSILAIFMGIQFSLSQFTQTQILVETFGDPGAAKNGNEFTASLFVLGTHSAAAFFVLALVLIFSDETSTFFANSFPLFNPIKTTHLDDACDAQQKESDFLKYIALAQIIYSLRYFALLSLNPTLRFRWVLVFMFQVAELFNFPIVWFALTCRVHELIAEHPAYIRSREGKRGDPASGSKSLNIHIVGQSLLALLYFVLSRYLAVFVHSLHVSLHLHNDNVDWFIYSFYQQRLAPTSDNQKIADQIANNNNTTSNSGEDQRTFESLFSPLPGERQTYLHASRLFLKYNSITCSIAGSYLLMNRLYINYQLWSMQKRTLSVQQPTDSESRMISEDSGSQQIDERLSMDLMRIRQANTRIIYPSEPNDEDVTAQTHRSSSKPQSPRAKILFHYNLGRRDSSDESLSSTTRLDTSTTGEEMVPTSNDQVELRIPIALEEEQEEVDSHDGGFQADHSGVIREAPNEEPQSDDFESHRARVGISDPSFQTGVLEKVVKHRNKKVRIFEDDEEWPVELPDTMVTLNHSEVPQEAAPTHRESRMEQDKTRGASRATLEPTSVTYARPNKRPTRVANIPNLMENNKHRKRTITFAPTATLIGHDDDGPRRPAEMMDSGPRYASPEPSIDNDSDRDEIID